MNDEVFQLTQALGKLNSTSFSERSIEDKWAALFKNKNLAMLRKLVSVLLSMFPSNAFCESVFSVVNSVWTDERNSFLIETVNALVTIILNSEFECSDSFDLFISRADLLLKAKSDDNMINIANKQ